MRYLQSSATLFLLWATCVGTMRAEPAISRTALFSLSQALAYSMGRAYQMGRNCGLEMNGTAPPKAAGLFINYFNEREVQKIMDNYGMAMKSEDGKACDKKELSASQTVLIEKTSNYINLATPHTRPHSAP